MKVQFDKMLIRFEIDQKIYHFPYRKQKKIINVQYSALSYFFIKAQSFVLLQEILYICIQMEKSNQKDEERFNKAVQIYVKKYQLNVYSLIKFIEEKIAVTPQTKNIIVSEILTTKSREQSITKDMLKMYLHMVAAAQARIDIRGKKIESFSQFYRLAFKESKPKDEVKVSDAKNERKEQKLQHKIKEEDRNQVKKQAEPQNQKTKTDKTSSEVTNKTHRTNQSSQDIGKQIQQKNRSSKQASSPKKQQLQVIEQDVIDQNRTSNVVYRTENTQQLLLKLPQAQMMNLKSQKSVQITGYDKFGQSYLNPIIKFHIIFGEHSVYRRYSEFQRLMNDLSRRYEGFILPELPPKEGIKSNLSYFWGVDEAFLNDRQVKLQEMMNCLLSSKFVNKDQILQKFLTDQDFEIEASGEGGLISYLKPITSIAINTKQLKNYGVAYYNYLKQFNKAQIHTTVTAKYKQVESLLNFCLLIDNYRNNINSNFERRRDVFRQLKMDQNDRNLTITKFDKLSASSASQIKNLSKQISKYLQLKSQQSWLSYLIREKESEAQSDIEQLKKNKEEIKNRINVMQVNLLTSIEQLRKQKIRYLQSVGDKMIQWRKSIHP